jgi:alpha-tubulin suppressor-like RCC1 family protein
MESLNLSQRTIVVEGSFAAGRSVLDCGGSHTAAVTKDGSLWQWGSGNDGRLGTGDHKRCDVPRRISGRELFGGPVASVAVGYLHTAVLTADGVLWTHGNGACGRLGLGDEEDRLTPTRLCQELFGNAKVLSVCCWWGHTVAVTNDGLTWTWGWGEYGQVSVECART